MVEEDNSKGFEPFVPKTEDEKTIIENLLKQGPKKTNEHHIIPLVGAYLRRQGFWVETQVNLWQLVGQYISPTDILKTYKHPLQPDVDILYGLERNNSRKTPLRGMEVKLFSEYKGKAFWNGKQIWPVIPKTKSAEPGFYSGLGQALVLYHFGMDYVFLCHVFILPTYIWEEKSTQDSNIADVLVEEHTEWSAAYGGIVEGTISKLNLPLGYLQLGIVLDNPVRLSAIMKKNAKLVPLCRTGRRIRDLLLDKFKIEDSVYRTC